MLEDPFLWMLFCYFLHFLFFFTAYDGKRWENLFKCQKRWFQPANGMGSTHWLVRIHNRHGCHPVYKQHVDLILTDILNLGFTLSTSSHVTSVVRVTSSPPALSQCCTSACSEHPTWIWWDNYGHFLNNTKQYLKPLLSSICLKDFFLNLLGKF